MVLRPVLEKRSGGGRERAESFGSSDMQGSRKFAYDLEPPRSPRIEAKRSSKGAGVGEAFGTPELRSSKPRDSAPPGGLVQWVGHRYRAACPARLDRLAACGAYAFCSVTMVLANKALATYLQTPETQGPNGSSALSPTPHAAVAVLPVAFQNFTAVSLLELLRAWGAVSYERLALGDAEKVSLVAPLSLCFVAMLLSGYMCLAYLNVPMVTIFKNATNLLIVAGEWALYDEPVSLGVWFSIAMMVLGAALAAANDLSFSSRGLVWALANCAATAGYVLYMRKLTRASDLSKFGAVLVNNGISLLLLLCLAAYTGELTTAAAAWSLAPSRQNAASNPGVALGGGGGWSTRWILLNAFTGLVGFSLNFAQLWCVGATSATTYAMVGTLNKIPIALLGSLLFSARMTTQGYVFVSVNLAGCLLYSYCKITEGKARRKTNGGTNCKSNGKPSISRSKEVDPPSEYQGSGRFFQSFPSSAEMHLKSKPPVSPASEPHAPSPA